MESSCVGYLESFIKMWFHSLISSYSFQYHVKPLHPSFSFTTTVSSPVWNPRKRKYNQSGDEGSPHSIRMITSKDVLDVTYKMVIVCPPTWNSDNIRLSSSGHWTPLNLIHQSRKGEKGDGGFTKVPWVDGCIQGVQGIEIEISLDSIAKRLVGFHKDNHCSILDILVDFLGTRQPDISQPSQPTYEVFIEFLALVKSTKLTQQEILSTFLQIAIFHSRLF